MHNQYRAKYGIPFVDEIKVIREQYGLTAAKMSELLGFGTNGYKNYENGEIPSIPHGRYIQFIKDPQAFKRLLELNRNEWEPEEWEKINRKVTQRLTGWDERERLEEQFLFGSVTPDEYSGFRKTGVREDWTDGCFFFKNSSPFYHQDE